MDNIMMPPVQPNVQYGSPTMQSDAVSKIKAKKDAEFLKTIAIVMLGLLALTFVGLFVWILIKYNDVNDDVNGKIELAVAAAREAQQSEDEEEFAEREKNPYLNFAGPVDYGELSFKYPRTWSLYVEADAANGGDFRAYFNPAQVDPISRSNIDALRLTIFDRDFEAIVSGYQGSVDSGELTMETINVGGSVANKYTGKIPNTADFNGFIVIIKIRDKTVVLQTDSVLFENDFNKLISTIKFNA